MSHHSAVWSVFSLQNRVPIWLTQFRFQFLLKECVINNSKFLPVFTIFDCYISGVLLLKNNVIWLLPPYGLLYVVEMAKKLPRHSFKLAVLESLQNPFYLCHSRIHTIPVHAWRGAWPVKMSYHISRSWRVSVPYVFERGCSALLRQQTCASRTRTWMVAQ